MTADPQPDADSADQQAWVKLAATVRDKLAKRAAQLATMDLDDAKVLVGSLREAMWFHQDALLFDKDVDLKMGRVTWSD